MEEKISVLSMNIYLMIILIMLRYIILIYLLYYYSTFTSKILFPTQLHYYSKDQF